MERSANSYSNVKQQPPLPRRWENSKHDSKHARQKEIMQDS